MKAMVISAYGGPEVFQQAELPIPQPGPTELLVRVVAAAVNPIDYKLRRASGFSNLKLPAILGYDAAGIVERVGGQVETFKPGDEVFYSPDPKGHPGSYAEYNVVDEAIVALKPHSITFIEAAGLPLAGCTALDAIDFMQIQPGQTVLIHAAAGGVGSLAVQMARAKGARVLATCSAGNRDFVLGLGVDEVIDYRSEDYTQAVMRLTDGTGVEAVYDTVGGDTISRSLPLLKPFGRMVSISRNKSYDMSPAYSKNITVYFGYMERSSRKMEELRRMVEDGNVRPLVDSVMPLEEVAAAHARLEKGGVAGKIILATGMK